jgi:hypothetical protein
MGNSLQEECCPFSREWHWLIVEVSCNRTVTNAAGSATRNLRLEEGDTSIDNNGVEGLFCDT